jgi:Cdc6-like AAA superfamily ATPase
MSKIPKSLQLGTPQPIDWASLAYEIAELFEAGPVLEEEMFAGRISEVRRMLEAVLDRSKHVVLYGERGVGKTSIANIFWKRYNKTLQTVIAARVQANPTDDFSSLWIKALEEFQNVSKTIGKSSLAPIESNYSVVTPDTIRREFSKCNANSIPIIVIDEYDKLIDADARLLTANVIKSFYDYSVNATIILVGVAEDIHDLIDDHESLRRALSQVKLERMSQIDLHELINKRTSRIPVKLDKDAQWTIVLLARGLPYYVHMLSKFTLQNAVYDERKEANIDDVWKAMERLVEEEEQSFKEDYRKATDSPQADNQFRQVLLACALAEADDAGYFTPASVLPKLSKITGKARKHAHFQRHLNEFVLTERGAILTRRGTERRYSYRFSDPMMQPYVVIRGVKDEYIPRDMRSILTFPEQPELFPYGF